MAKTDKDRHLKELAIRYCLSSGNIPYLEVLVKSASELSDTVEVLTDIDVLGLSVHAEGNTRRTIFDCKSAGRMSSINRAFWAAGLKEYTGCHEAFVILKSRAVHNHRISALSMSVDLHDERSFADLGTTLDPTFPADNCYQSSITRWEGLSDCYARNTWAQGLRDLAQNIAPLTDIPSTTFRQILAELRACRGQFDPSKDDHLAIFFDVLASTSMLWSVLGRDIRRFYDPEMKRPDFEKILRYYIWGGKNSYNIRQQMRAKAWADGTDHVEFPAWEELMSFVGIILSAPQHISDCAYVFREMSLRAASENIPEFDERLHRKLSTSSRLTQFSIALSEYLTKAGKLPTDMAKQVENALLVR